MRFVFYKNNRCDRQFQITSQELIEKFKKWRKDNPHMAENWPFVRQVGLFLSSVGSYDVKANSEILKALRTTNPNKAEKMKVKVKHNGEIEEITVITQKQVVLEDLQACIDVLDDMVFFFPEIERLPIVIDDLRTVNRKIEENL